MLFLQKLSLVRIMKFKVPKYSVTFFISILLTIFLISSNYYTECECQEHVEDQEISSTVDKDQIVGQSSYVPTSNPYANQASYNYNPNYYTSSSHNDPDGHHYPQTPTDHTSMYNSTMLNIVDPQGQGWSINPHSKNNYRTNYVSLPHNYYGHYTNKLSVDKSQSTQLANVHHPHPPPPPPAMKIPKNHLKLRRRVENHEAHAMGEEWGRSIGETVMSSALFPVTFFAFSMIFLDIMGRIVPVRVPTLRSVLGWTTTTPAPPPPPPPPKITKIEISPPPIPNIGDIIAEQVKGLHRLKAQKKATKASKYTDYSDEYYGWNSKRRRLPVNKSKKKKRGKKKKTGGGMTWKKLQELYQTYKPTVL